MAFKVGDIVFWATASAAGEYTVIGHPKWESPRVLVFEGGGEVDAEDLPPRPAGCAPVRSDKSPGGGYLEEFPGKLEGST